MKQKINLLISFSFLILITLISIQCYLVKTSYDYKVEQFQDEVKEKISKITDDYSDNNSTILDSKKVYHKRLKNYYIQNDKSESSKNPFRDALTREIQRKIEHEFPKNDVEFAVVINNKAQKGKLSAQETLFVSVKNWKQVILSRMITILILSVISILILLFLFVIAIRALINQRQVNDIKTDFINNITHELKTPLTTLSVSTKILERKEVKENEAVFNSVLETINRQNVRLQNIIDQVMSNSLGFEEIEFQKEQIQPNLLLKAIVADFNLAYPNIVIMSDFTGIDVELSLDKFHLTTAINNVFENAVKYGCQSISIKTSRENNLFTISIQDDGIGIPKSKQSLLFEKFYRVEQGNLHNVKGLGLGLYYVEQIIKAHKGSVKVVSDLGKGASFIISIPSI